jgi:AraC family transcriptional regulator of adaptative response/methylated-DNA-[protein]-cysteine methyltransferase
MTLAQDEPLSDERWTALRDKTEGREVLGYYAVITTGVFCRMTCPSRTPRRENVRFFATVDAARAAGFRACKRCKPEAADPSGGYANAIARACHLIEVAEDTPDMAAIAKAVGLSRFHFHRLFKAATGLTPGAYLRAFRRDRTMAALGKGATVTDAIHSAGYGSTSRFYESVAPALGLSPAAYKKGGHGETIRFAVGRCTLGSILVASTAKGVCAILLGDDPDELVRDLQDRFPKADLVGGDADYEGTIVAAVGLVDAPRHAFALPLDVRGTAFQHRVWTALRAIPAGKTASYAEVAAMIGMPDAVRSVAGACARNPIAVAIPCHRVVRTDRSLSGYRWGVDRKAELLKREAAGHQQGA